MTEQRSVDITELAVVGEQFPLRLMQLGFRIMQVVDEVGQDQVCYVLPPVCEVPAGPFLMGGDKGKTSLANDSPHVLTLQAFQIGQYPLTVAEYVCFVQATGHAVYRPTSLWRSQLYHTDHPVVFVSWSDVLAYARWMEQVTGKPWRLPSEAEWEKAARGTDGRLYPWGNDWEPLRAQMMADTRNATASVGSFPTGVSPYGAHDMSSNVWEWTSTRQSPNPYQAHDGREDLTIENSLEYRVMRGGAQFFALKQNEPATGRNMPVTERNFEHPSEQLNTFGGRLVCGEATS